MILLAAAVIALPLWCIALSLMAIRNTIRGDTIP